jgi:hypothetical protein
MKLTGESLVKLIQDWSELQKCSGNLGQEALRVLNPLMPAAYAKRFPRGGDFDKHARYKASALLVKWLNHDEYHFRDTGIKTLEAMYHTRRMYQPEMDPRDRKKRIDAWNDYIRKERRR